MLGQLFKVGIIAQASMGGTKRRMSAYTAGVFMNTENNREKQNY